jgi:sugar lactone lactonase YvrE
VALDNPGGGIGLSADGQFLAVPSGNGISVLSTGSTGVVGTSAAVSVDGMTLWPDPGSTGVYFGSTTTSGVNYIGRLDMPSGQVAQVAALDSRVGSLIATRSGLFASTDTGVRYVDLSTGTASGVSDTSGHLSLSPDGATAYLVSGTSFSTIDVGSRHVREQHPLNLADTVVNDVEISADGRRIVVAQSKGISVIDVASGAATWFPLDEKSFHAAVDASGSVAYTTNELSAQVEAVSLADGHVIATVPVEDGPRSLVMSGDGKQLYVVNSGSKSVTVLSLH